MVWIITLLGCIVVSIALLLVYFILEPRLSRLDKFSIWRVYCEWMLISLVVIFLLFVLLYTSWRLPVSLDSLKYDIIAPATAFLNRGHALTCLAIPVIFFVCWRLCRLDVWHSFILSLIMPSVHEGLWFSLRYFFNWKVLDWAVRFQIDTGYLLIAATTIIVYAVKYRFGYEWLYIVGVQGWYEFLLTAPGGPYSAAISSLEFVSDISDIAGWWLCTILILLVVYVGSKGIQTQFYPKPHRHQQQKPLYLLWSKSVPSKMIGGELAWTKLLHSLIV
jgi:hypothetical protein